MADLREMGQTPCHPGPNRRFPICPNPGDPDACNVYKDLQFPEGVYGHISEYYEQKAHQDEQPAA